MERFTRIELDSGVRLIEEGESDEDMLILESGGLDVLTGDTHLGTAVPGDLVGEAALFGYPVRTASVVTSSPCSILLLNRAGYQELRESSSPVAWRLEQRALDLVTDRLRTVGERIGKASEGTPVSSHATQGLFQRVSRMFGAGGQKRTDHLDLPFVLRQTRMFSDAPPDALRIVGEQMEQFGFGPGAFLCTQGELGETFFVLASGKVEVLIGTPDGGVEPLAQLQPGASFGQMALVSDEPRMASCVAVDKVTVATLSREAFQALRARDDLAGSVLRVALLRSLSEQLAYANGQLAQLDWVARSRSKGDVRRLMMASAGVEANLGGR
ncbi:MAG: cyclic nucleotide-binding domain-containing protein [Proteobacteria bacterium]|nr:cyclic nucleotide-binding domain-containing protein [Pseudomonadota bacterium]